MILFHVVEQIQVLVQKPRFIWLLEVPTQSPEDDEFNTQPLPADRRNQTFSSSEDYDFQAKTMDLDRRI